MVVDLFEQFHPLLAYGAIVVFIVAAAFVGDRFGEWAQRSEAGRSDTSTLSGATLGLVGLLLAFTFSLALSRYEARRNWVVEEANAISSTANFALMLPRPAQKPILDLLHEYTEVRAGLGVPFDPDKFQRDIARSLDLQNRLWQHAVDVTAAAPQSLPAYRFVASLNEINNIHERRLSALLYHVPRVVMGALIGVAMVAMGFTGYLVGTSGGKRIVSIALMSVTLGGLILLIVDLDRPARGLIVVKPVSLEHVLENYPAPQPP